MTFATMRDAFAQIGARFSFAPFSSVLQPLISNSRFGNFAQAHRPKRADAGAKNDQHRLFYGGAALKQYLLDILGQCRFE